VGVGGFVHGFHARRQDHDRAGCSTTPPGWPTRGSNPDVQAEWLAVPAEDRPAALVRQARGRCRPAASRARRYLLTSKPKNYHCFAMVGQFWSYGGEFPRPAKKTCSKPGSAMTEHRRTPRSMRRIVDNMARRGVTAGRRRPASRSLPYSTWTTQGPGKRNRCTAQGGRDCSRFTGALQGAAAAEAGHRCGVPLRVRPRRSRGRHLFWFSSASRKRSSRRCTVQRAGSPGQGPPRSDSSRRPKKPGVIVASNLYIAAGQTADSPTNIAALLWEPHPSHDPSRSPGRSRRRSGRLCERALSAAVGPLQSSGPDILTQPERRRFDVAIQRRGDQARSLEIPHQRPAASPREQCRRRPSGFVTSIGCMVVPFRFADGQGRLSQHGKPPSSFAPRIAT